MAAAARVGAAAGPLRGAHHVPLRGAGDAVEELDARIARLREEEERQKEEKVRAC